MNLFGKKKDDDKEEDKKIAANMQSLSDQIGALQRQLLERNKQVEALQKDLKQTDLQSTFDKTAAEKRLQDAQAQITQLQHSLKDASAGAQAGAGQQLQAAQSQIETLQKQLTEMQTAAQTATQAPAQQAPTPSYAPRAAGIPGLAIGGSAWVKKEGGMPLRLRNAPDLDESKVIDRLAIGTQMTILGGPNPSDGYTWYHIRTNDGREGWVAGENLVAQPE
jgi:hypothetical protein